MVFLLLACATPVIDEPPPPRCNGSAALCELPVDEAVFAGTHNSHASQELGYNLLAANQFSAIPTQLEDGIRALNVDTYIEDGEFIACHGFCVLGSQPVDELLAGIEAFLADHPREVVLLDFQSYGHDATLAAALEASGLAERAFGHEPGASWPTLGELIDGDTRVFLSTSQGGDPTWLHSNQQHYTFTNYHYTSVESFDCALRFDTEGGLFLVAHHLYDPLSSPDLADVANTQTVLQDRVADCEAEHGRQVNVLSVDYYENGDLLSVVAAVNP